VSTHHLIRTAFCFTPTHATVLIDLFESKKYYCLSLLSLALAIFDPPDYRQLQKVSQSVIVIIVIIIKISMTTAAAMSPEQQQQQQQDEALTLSLSRKQRKMEGKQQKRKRIEESGVGRRPRTTQTTTTSETPSTTANTFRSSSNNNINNSGSKRVKGGSPFLQQESSSSSSSLSARKKKKKHDRDSNGSNGAKRGNNNNNNFTSINNNNSKSSQHRFGRVMEHVPCRNKPRYSTLSIALPGSVLANCQTKELRTLLVGQIARAATIYHVDEIVVFDDQLGSEERQQSHHSAWRDYHKRQKHQQQEQQEQGSTSINDDPNGEQDKHPDGYDQGNNKPRFPKSNSQEFMARLLQYCECPQYLRRSFFPMHPDLQFAGLLAPVDAPHHVRAEDRSQYREGVVLDKTSSSKNGNSLVNCGIRNRPVE
jgi:predicted SPOUT superfamily RNA methylase MTH1